MTGTDNRGTPYTLWLKARQEHPDDKEACGRRHVELMREAGMIVPRRPGESRKLPCGWDPFKNLEGPNDNE